MANTHIFQILTHFSPRRELDPGFGVLDNSSNERPDWFEYWPIRRFLLSEPLNEEAFYGFLSPKFRSKTNLTAAQVFEFIEQSDHRTEVILFSPSIHTGAQFLNVFEHGDAMHPGLLAASKKLLIRINRQTNLDDLVTDSRNTVHSNYFVARPRFWREWLAITGQSVDILYFLSRPLGGANESIHLGARCDVDSCLRSDLCCARAQSIRRPQEAVQIAAGNRQRRIEDCLQNTGVRPIQGCVSVDPQATKILEFPDQACCMARRAGRAFQHARFGFLLEEDRPVVNRQIYFRLASDRLSAVVRVSAFC